VDIGGPGAQPGPEHPIVIPDPGGGEHPEHPIAPGGGPSHPIVLPPDAIWPPGSGIDMPDQGLPGEQPHPDQGLPGDQPGVSHPIAPGGGPTHPIVLPTPPDGGEEQVGGLEFYQRKTLGINWDSSFDECAVVTVQAGTTADDLVTVRTVANDGTSSVTYPQDFTGEVTIRVCGMDGYLEGTTTVK
jgi:hypothetical protein